MIQALRNLIDLYTFYFETLERTLDGLLDLLSVEVQGPAGEDVDPWRNIHTRVSLADIAHEVKGLGYKACASATGFGGTRSNGPETA